MGKTAADSRRWIAGALSAIAAVAFLIFAGYQLLYTAPRPLEAAAFISQAQGASSYCLVTSQDNGQRGTATVRLTYPDSTSQTLQAALASPGHSWLLAPNWEVTSLQEVASETACPAGRSLAVSPDSAAQSVLGWLGLPVRPDIPTPASPMDSSSNL